MNDKMSTQEGSRTKHYIGRTNRDNEAVIFYKGEIIFLEGQDSKCAYIIESGRDGDLPRRLPRQTVTDLDIK